MKKTLLVIILILLSTTTTYGAEFFNYLGQGFVSSIENKFLMYSDITSSSPAHITDFTTSLATTGTVDGITANLGYSWTRPTNVTTTDVIWIATSSITGGSVGAWSGSWATQTTTTWSFNNTIPEGVYTIIKFQVTSTYGVYVPWLDMTAYGQATGTAPVCVFNNGSYPNGNCMTSSTIAGILYGDREVEPEVDDADIVFQFPTNGITTPEPDMFVFELINIEPYTTYYIKATAISSQGGTSTTKYSDSLFVNGSSTHENYITIQNPFRDYMSTFDANSTTSVTASLILSRDPNFGFINIIDVDQATFIIDNEATEPTSTASSYGAPFGTAYEKFLNASIYYNCESWSDLACNLKNFGIWFMWGGASLPNTMDSISTNIRETKLYSTFFKAANVASSSMTENTTSSDLYLQLHIGNATSNIKIAGTSYLKDTFGTPIVNLFYNIVLVMASLGAFGIIYYSVLKL